MYRPQPLKLGHLVLKVRDIHASAKFYQEVVGLEVSDWIEDRMVFMRAGQDHHDLALSQLLPHGVDAPAECTGLEHFSYQVEDFSVMEKTVEMLRERGVVGRFVEYFGPGLASLSLADRATIANMAPEYGATCGYFPIDDETLRYLRNTGRDEDRVARAADALRKAGAADVTATPLRYVFEHRAWTFEALRRQMPDAFTAFAAAENRLLLATALARL